MRALGGRLRPCSEDCGGGNIGYPPLLLAHPVAVLWGWSGFFACFLPLQLVGGFFLAAVFAVSHNVPEILYNPPRAAAAPTKTHSLPREEDGKAAPAAAPPPMDWAEMQIRASANWSVGSSFWLLASGGLNYQVRQGGGGGWATAYWWTP